MLRLILASASPRRAQILRDAGLSFTVTSSAVDESHLLGESAQDYVLRLARAKADLVAARSIGPSIVIAADTVVVLGEQILGKPRTTDDARTMLESLSGKTHQVLTGVTLVRLPDTEHLSFAETTRVQFSSIPPEAISYYLSTEEPYDKAGAYAIQGFAGRYIPRIEGCYFNVVGLPLTRVVEGLRQLGWSEAPAQG